MKRIMLIGVVGLSLGCVHIQPVGPFADGMTSKAKTPPEAEVPEPEVRSAPKPTPPALYVTPGEVTPANAADAVKRLQQEMEIDRRAMEAMPKYSEVSVIKGGVK
jgi:hypothetical protein